MKANHPIDPLENAGLDHGLRSAGALLGGLEGESHHAGEVLLAAGKRLGDLERDRHMHVMATGVHHAGIR